MRFDDRVVLVSCPDPLTAASAVLLARRGAQIVVHDPGSGPDAPGAAGEELAARVIGDGGTAVTAGHPDLADGGADAVVAVAKDAFGRLDVVILGTELQAGGALDAVPEASVLAAMGTQLFGPLRLLRAAWLEMRDQGYGRAVLVVPLEAIQGAPEASAYGAARGGLVGLMNVLKLEGPRHNIGVNIVAPLTSGPDAPAAAGPGPATVAYLCHEQSTAAGQMYAVRADAVARMFIAVTPGYFDADLDADGVGRHLEEIFDPEGLVFADEGGQEMPFLKRHLR